MALRTWKPRVTKCCSYWHTHSAIKAGLTRPQTKLYFCAFCHAVWQSMCICICSVSIKLYFKNLVQRRCSSQHNLNAHRYLSLGWCNIFHPCGQGPVIYFNCEVLSEPPTSSPISFRTEQDRVFFGLRHNNFHYISLVRNWTVTLCLCCLTSIAASTFCSPRLRWNYAGQSWTCTALYPFTRRLVEWQRRTARNVTE